MAKAIHIREIVSATFACDLQLSLYRCVLSGYLFVIIGTASSTPIQPPNKQNIHIATILPVDALIGSLIAGISWLVLHLGQILWFAAISPPQFLQYAILTLPLSKLFEVVLFSAYCKPIWIKAFGLSANIRQVFGNCEVNAPYSMSQPVTWGMSATECPFQIVLRLYPHRTFQAGTRANRHNPVRPKETRSCRMRPYPDKQ